jgi:hypothetical protein
MLHSLCTTDAALDELAVFGQDADLTGVLVKVDADKVHG